VVLLRRNEGKGRPCVVLVLDGSSEDHEGTLAATRALAGPRDRLHAVLLGGNRAASRDTLSRQFERAHLANVSLERCSDLAGVGHFLAQLNPGLAAIETAALERTSCGRWWRTHSAISCSSEKPRAMPAARALPLAPLAAVALMALAGSLASPASAVVGMPAFHLTEERDTLLDMAREHDVGYVAIRAANPRIDPWLPGIGKLVTLPVQHILPDAPHRGIVINLPELRLYYYPARGDVRTFPIGIGGEGKETPLGHTQIANKRPHPVWVPTKSEHEEEPDLPASVGPGPDNPMGDFALYLGWKGYAMHGTNKPYSIGRRDSHGCIRLYPEDIEWLYRAVAIGTPVTVVNQPAKVGWSGGELYLEVNPTEDDVDALETEGVPNSSEGIDADELVAKAAGADISRLDWYTIHLTEVRRDGVPVQVTRPVPY